MDDKRREDIGIVAEHFKNGIITQDALTAFCQRRKIEPVALSEIQDFLVQLEHDEIVSRSMPLIMAELAKLRYTPEFSKQSERKAIAKANDEVRVNIAKIFEESGMDYLFVKNTADEIGTFVSGVITMAGNTIANKCADVLLHIAKAKFGGHFTAKDAADYAVELYKAFDKKEE